MCAAVLKVSLTKIVFEINQINDLMPNRFSPSIAQLSQYISCSEALRLDGLVAIFFVDQLLNTTSTSTVRIRGMNTQLMLPVCRYVEEFFVIAIKIACKNKKYGNH